MSNQTKKSGLFTAASILLLINMIMMIVSLVVFVLYLIVITALYAVGMLTSMETAQESIITIIALIVIVGIISVIGAVYQIAMIVVYGIARKKLLKANAKKDYMGWMIACIVLSVVLSINILGLVGPILALCVPESDFETPENDSLTDGNFAADNTSSDF